MKRWSRMLFLSICLMCVLCACMGQKEDILIGGEEDATGTINPSKKMLSSCGSIKLTRETIS